MTSTAFHPTASMRARMTRLFVRGRDGRLVATGPIVGDMYEESSRMLSGGAGLLSTIPDYARFAQMLLNGGELDGHRILQWSTVDLMMESIQISAVFRSTIVATATRAAPGQHQSSRHATKR